jgi:hypothetical protein
MTFTQARTLTVGDCITDAAQPGYTGTILAIRRGVWTIGWEPNDDPEGGWIEERPMGVCSKLEVLK